MRADLEVRYGYPFLYRIRSILIIILLPVTTYMTGVRGCISALEDGYVGLFWFFAVAMGLLIVAGIFSAWTSWFYMYRYELKDGVLVVVDPVLRRSWRVDLRSVCRIYDFRVLGELKEANSSRGHELVDDEGRMIRLTETLPIWPQISELVKGVPAEKKAGLRRWVL